MAALQRERSLEAVKRLGCFRPKVVIPVCGRNDPFASAAVDEMRNTPLVLANNLSFLQLSNFLIREAKLLEHGM